MSQSQISSHGETGCISLPSRFDMMSSAEYRVPFIRFLVNSDTRKLVVDFSHLDYIDSSGIGTLISWEKTCREKGKALILSKCHARVVKIFRQTGVEPLFTFS